MRIYRVPLLCGLMLLSSVGLASINKPEVNPFADIHSRFERSQILLSRSDAANLEQGRQQLLELVELDYTPAVFALGKARIGGSYGLKQDIARGLELLKKAAFKGHSGAMFYLGQLYQQGGPVDQNPVHAYGWSFAAEMVQHPGASSLRFRIERSMSEDMIRQGRLLGKYLMRRRSDDSKESFLERHPELLELVQLI